MPRNNPDSDPFSSLLAMLRARMLRSDITSVVDEAAINLMYKLLSRDPKDYVNIAEHLSDDSDVKILLDFMLHLLYERRLTNAAGPMDINLRARQLMLKVATRTPAIPLSLKVTGVSVQSDHSLIGSGGFGNVFKGELAGAPVALKVLYKTHNNMDFRREALMWRSLNDNYVLPFLGIYEDGSTSFLVSPYMKNGTLAQWRQKANPSIEAIEERMLEVARGMEYIHSEGVVHGDLRGDNILLDADFHVKIADFGLTRLSEATPTRSGALHLNFAAPELLGMSTDDTSDDVPARTQKSDVYAFGCLYYEIHYHAIPFAGRQEFQIMRLISRGELPPRLDEPPLSNEAWNLIQCCWMREASKRPIMKGIAEKMMTVIDPFPSFLSILKDKKPGSPITSVVNTRTVNLIHKFLSREDYVNVAEQLSNTSDANDLVDFILHLLRNSDLSNSHATLEANRRARRLMLNILAKTRVMPTPLFVTGVGVKTDRDYISGSFGLVFKGKLHGKIVALKVLHEFEGHDNIDVFREALMWRSLHHKFILPFLGIYKEESISQSFLVTPYIEHGTLAQWQKAVKPTIAEMEERILEVAQGIAYIHSEGVVHGDIRGANVFLDDNFHVQIAGFGLSRVSEDPDTASGATHFAAPELCGFSEDDISQSDHYAQQMEKTYKSDVYAFGCLYYEIYYDTVPFAAKRDVHVMWLVSRGERPRRLDEPPLSDWAWKLIQSCWVHEASKRPEMKDVVERMTAARANEAWNLNLDSVGHPFPTLLSILKDKKPRSPVASVVNKTTVNLIHKLLSREDYINVAAQLSDTTIINDFVDFMQYLLFNGDLSNSHGMSDVNRRARRLICKIIAKTPVIPRSFFVPGVEVKADPDLIGVGRFGLVFKAELWGDAVALKVLHRVPIKSDFCREALMWQSLSHQFLLPFLGIFYEDKLESQVFLVSPYMENGTLTQWRKNANPSIAQIEQLILEVAQGVAYIHSEGVVHGDIHGTNVLLDPGYHVQITDFGLSRVSDDPDSQTGALRYNYSAPELFGFSEDAISDSDADTQQMARAYKSDLYAFACLYYEIHYDVVPFEGIMQVRIMQLIVQGERSPRLAEPPLSDWAWNLIQSSWVQEASRRPGMKDVAERMMDVRANEAWNLDPDSDGHPFLSLLSILKDKKPGSPIASVVNTTTVNLIQKLLSREDYINVAAQLSDTVIVNNLVDFMLYMLCNGDLSNSYATLDATRRARQLMLTIIAKTPVMPRSLFVTGVRAGKEADHLGDYIASGSFRPVVIGELRGKIVVLRVLYKAHTNVDICRQALMWRSLNHKFVLPFLGIHEDKLSSQLYLVSPYMENGTLAQWRKNTNPSVAEIEQLILEVAQGIAYIHSEGVVHGDICGAHVLLDDKFHPQIYDFGLARSVESTVTGSGVLHRNFAAPELFVYTDDDTPYSESSTARTQESDIYAFSSLYYEIHYDVIPFDGVGAVPFMRGLSRGERPPRLDYPPLSDDAWKLMHRCWAHDKRLRPGIRDVVKIMKWWWTKPPELSSPAPLLPHHLRPSLKADKPNYLARAYRSIRKNSKRGKRA